jgi:hypothetical protein
MDMYNLTVNQLIDTLKRKGLAVFEADTKDYNLNYVGVRSKNQKPNAFDDMFYMFWKYKGEWKMVKHTGTTDPGLFWLQKPTNVDGTAILKKGQYRGTWQQGLHQGKYPALVQRKAVTVTRDDDKDSVLDFDATKEKTGFFGINHHRTGTKMKSTQVDRWSAGCQVRNDPKQYEEFWKIILESGKIWGNSYTYTLIDEADLNS